MCIPLFAANELLETEKSASKARIYTMYEAELKVGCFRSTSDIP